MPFPRRVCLLGTLCLVISAFPSCLLRAQTATGAMASGPDAEARIGWWRDAKFGLFLHWGVYSILGRGEWVEWNEQIPVDQYAKLADQFHPEHFDPDAWAALARDAGMKYAVLTARHHDGFALFDDPESTFTSVKSTAHRDFVADYAAAMRKAGIRVGLYYSPLDWRYPGFFFPGIYKPNAITMREQFHRQLHELASHYGKIDILWFDGGEEDWLGFGGVGFENGWHARPKGEHYTGAFTWQSPEAVDDLRRLQPSVLINNRTSAPADFLSREGDQAMGDFDNQHPWELCTTLTEGAWGYQPNARLKSRKEVVHLLVNAAGRDGNFLLNVGPRPDGQIESAQADRLREVGRWLARNGESIYTTRGGPFLPGRYGVCTRRGNVIYAHVLEWPEGSLRLPAVSAKVVRATVLGRGEVGFEQNDRGIAIRVPPADRDAVDTIVRLEMDRSVATLARAAVMR